MAVKKENNQEVKVELLNVHQALNEFKIPQRLRYAFELKFFDKKIIRADWASLFKKEGVNFEK